MQRNLTLRGVPRALARDGWWLLADLPNEGAATGPTAAPSPRDHAPVQRRVLVLLALVLAGDLLFWGHAPGLSLALFAALILAGFAALGAARRPLQIPALLLALGTLPVIEHVQTLSVGFLILGTLTALALARLPSGTSFAAITSTLTGLLRALPLTATKDLIRPLRQAPRHPEAPALRQMARNWALPIGGALILISLLIQANPILERGLSDLLRFDLDALAILDRALLWLGLGLLVWPLLTAPALPAALPRTGSHKTVIGLNAGSVLRALWVFNGLLAVQTLMDLSILVGGAALPEGMSHAEYAHRGAYPLLVTAMLAGAFALAARPFVGEARVLKPLLLLWLGQNVLLCLSSVLRLDLYVDAFGLTYLRIHAMIWMALVATSLALILWQVMRAHSNIWLSLRAAAVGLGTLYACCFVNFAQIIATQNLAREAAGMSFDQGYICRLGPMAYDAVKQTPLKYCTGQPKIDDWRDWTFRAARVGQ